MSINNGQKFERLVAALHFAEARGAEVRWNDTIKGRQFDVTVRFKHGLHQYLTVIECKDYSRKVPVEKVESFVTKYRDINANKAVMVSSSGFQVGCLDVANRHGITLLTLREVLNNPVDFDPKDLKPALNIYNVTLFSPDRSEDFRLEEWGGRLAYLMNNIEININGEVVKLNNVINKWQIQCPWKFGEAEMEFKLEFSDLATAKIPFEGELKVLGVQFTCKIVEAIVTNKPYFDNHIRESLATNYELVDEKGSTYYSAPFVGLPLGCGNKVREGAFYSIPSLEMYYYCAKNDGKQVSWVLVESYQHGQLLRAKITQDIEYSWAYVEVTDLKTIQRLRLLYEDYQSLN
jgi:hypothetical protein